MKTRIVQVKDRELGNFGDRETLEKWEFPCQASAGTLRETAERLRNHQIPVAFPTETVYGLGADATQSSAVQRIYQAKGRQSDNPLIIHICDLTMLREIIAPGHAAKAALSPPPTDPIPAIYMTLIKRFWPGPLTILLPKAPDSKLAPEVSAGLPTFGARMPDSLLALSLISLVGQPLAAPSANTSTKPSPTTADHVLQDLDGKIELIIDGGACRVGVESTVVDGLCNPPVVLRPGGISLDLIRECSGWQGAIKAYQDKCEIGCQPPRAPGMKYKHYSPKAPVILYESDFSPKADQLERVPRNGMSIPEAPLSLTPQFLAASHCLHDPNTPMKIGIIRTKCWAPWGGLNNSELGSTHPENPTYPEGVINVRDLKTTPKGFSTRQGELMRWQERGSGIHHSDNMAAQKIAELIEISLGSDVGRIAHCLFAALRELDEQSVNVIHVEGIEDEGDIAGAVMNRLRKAASVTK